MNIDRAQEILQSERTIPVEHQGTSIWIDSVDAGSNKVKVHSLDNTGDSRLVKAEELTEVR